MSNRAERRRQLRQGIKLEKEKTYTLTISKDLKNLKNAKLIKNRKEGKTVFYSLADEHVVTILNQGIEHIEE